MEFFPDTILGKEEELIKEISSFSIHEKTRWIDGLKRFGQFYWNSKIHKGKERSHNYVTFADEQCEIAKRMLNRLITK